MVDLSRLLPGLWSLAWALWGAGLGLAQHGYLAAAALGLAMLPLAKGMYGRFDRAWLALPLSLTGLEALDAACQRPPMGCRWAFAAAAAVIVVGTVRKVIDRSRYQQPTDEPEDLLLLALAFQAWPLLVMSGAIARLPRIAVVVTLLSAAIGWLLSRRQPLSAAHRLERLGCWNGQASWRDPFPVSRWLLLPAWGLLWLAAPLRMRLGWRVDRLVATWREHERGIGGADWSEEWRSDPFALDVVGIEPGQRLAFRDSVVEAVRSHASLSLELHLLQQAAALACGRLLEAIATGQRIALLAGASGLTARQQRLIDQAIGETALTFARIERPVEAAAWLDRMGPDPVLDIFLRPVVTLLCEPPEMRTDERWRPILNLPWSEQVPLSAPLRRWQRVVHVEQVRLRLAAGQDAGAAAQGVPLGGRAIAEMPPDEALVVARLQAAEGTPALAWATLETLLGLPDLPAGPADRARAELARLAEE